MSKGISHYSFWHSTYYGGWRHFFVGYWRMTSFFIDTLWWSPKITVTSTIWAGTRNNLRSYKFWLVQRVLKIAGKTSLKWYFFWVLEECWKDTRKRENSAKNESFKSGEKVLEEHWIDTRKRGNTATKTKKVCRSWLFTSSSRHSIQWWDSPEFTKVLILKKEVF